MAETNKREVIHQNSLKQKHRIGNATELSQVCLHGTCGHLFKQTNTLKYERQKDGVTDGQTDNRELIPTCHLAYEDNNNNKNRN